MTCRPSQGAVLIRREGSDAVPSASVEPSGGEHDLYDNAQDNAMWQKDDTALDVEYQYVC